ncbi:MAG TPA: DUF309 domain-containing protein [Isosphaeraceae bacterium]|nr:DUF309 domain-containing protein [Isosphaeraceae bacterium]
MIPERDEPFPPYAFVPGGPWPHPTGSPEGHSARRVERAAGPILPEDGPGSALYRRGAALFNAGYYWEAHEAWEALWHAHGRRGATADLLKGLIKLAAAGVKVRERQPRGVITHARRAAALFASARAEAGAYQLGLNLEQWIAHAQQIADHPPKDPEPSGVPVSRVFPFQIIPS